MCQVKLQQNGDKKKTTLNHAPGGEINEGRSEVRLNPPSCFRGGYGSAKQNERLARSLHCQCCSVRKATQCHLKPTGTAPARGKAAVALPGERCLQTAHGSCNARLWQHTRLEGRFGRASREDRRTSSQTQRNITEPHLFTPGGRLRPFLLAILLWVSQGREDSSKLAVRQQLCLQHLTRVNLQPRSRLPVILVPPVSSSPAFASQRDRYFVCQLMCLCTPLGRRGAPGFNYGSPRCATSSGHFPFLTKPRELKAKTCQLWDPAPSNGNSVKKKISDSSFAKRRKEK